MLETINCKKCRYTLFDRTECCRCIVNAHSVQLLLKNNNTEDDEKCLTIFEENLLFLKDDEYPEWIRRAIENKNWLKGKLKCKHCDFRIGAFDFTSGSKCACSYSVLPSVYIIKSRVDCKKIF